jgi:hypothetical protein
MELKFSEQFYASLHRVRTQEAFYCYIVLKLSDGVIEEPRRKYGDRLNSLLWVLHAVYSMNDVFEKLPVFKFDFICYTVEYEFTAITVSYKLHKAEYLCTHKSRNFDGKQILSEIMNDYGKKMGQLTSEFNKES